MIIRTTTAAATTTVILESKSLPCQSPHQIDEQPQDPAPDGPALGQLAERQHALPGAILRQLSTDRILAADDDGVDRQGCEEGWDAVSSSQLAISTVSRL